MCEKLTSSVIKVRLPFEVGIWNISSHVRTWGGLKIADGLRCDWREIEWREGDGQPDIRFRDEDDAELRMEVMTWFLNRWPERMDYCQHCVTNLHDIEWDGATWPSGLALPSSIGGYANFGRLTDAKGLAGLKSIGGYANFGRLTDAKGLAGLKSIGGHAYFGSLTDAKGLAGLKSIGGDAYFGSLTDAKGLAGLKSIGGDANFGRLTDAKGIALPPGYKGSVYLLGAWRTADEVRQMAK